jgi:hypothetical protein
MPLLLMMGTSGKWRGNARWVVTDVSTYISSFILIGQIVQEGCSGLLDAEDGGILIIETAGRVYSKKVTSWHLSVILLKNKLHKLSIIVIWRAIVAAQCHCQYSCPHTNVCAWKDHVGPPEEGKLSFVRRMCQRCSVRCLFVLSLKKVRAGGLYVKLELLCREIQRFV